MTHHGVNPNPADPSHRAAALRIARDVSMLGDAALELLAELGARCRGPMIEIGPYIGGSTIALVSASSARLITMEVGGDNPWHDQLPTPDIIADLEKNLVRAGVGDRVSVVNGNFRAASCHEAVERQLEGQQASLLFVDVLPGPDVAAAMYAGLLDPNAYIVIDDYKSDIAVEKAAAVQAWVNAAVAAGALCEIGVFGWGTWFGRLTGAGAVERLKTVPRTLPAVHEAGHCWQAFVGHRQLSDDLSNNASSLRLLEDGRELGPAHSMHDDVRGAGLGRYSHWNGQIWFSASDNTDPTANGRGYAFRVADREYRLNSVEALPD